MFVCLVENIVCCKKTVKIGKMVKKWRKSPYFGEKIAKNGGFLRVFGRNRGVFGACALSCPAELWNFVGLGPDWGGK